MGGSSKKQTVGYKIYVDQQLVICAGPIDGVSRWTWDGKEAWSGWCPGGRIDVDKPELFGGEKREGGITGAVDVCLGGPTQAPNDYLVSKLGALVNAARGACTAVLRGLYVGLNPYLKRPAVRAHRIHVRGANGATQWYDEKAAIPTDGAGYYVTTTLESARDFNASDAATTPEASAGTWSVSGLAPSDRIVISLPPGGTYKSWSRWLGYGTDPGYYPDGTETFPLWWGVFSVKPTGGSRTDYLTGTDATTEVEAGALAQAVGPVILTGATGYQVWLADDVLYNRGGMTLKIERQQYIQPADMNPAHIIREAWTDPRMTMGLPDADVDDEALSRAADLFFAEGFGLSTLWSEEQPVGDFVDDICRHIDAEWYVDRRTGKLTLYPIRDNYDPAALVILDRTNTDSVENLVQPLPGEMVNSITVEFWDEEIVKDGVVTVNNDALVDMQGGVNGKTVRYSAISNRVLAARVGVRELRVCGSPLRSCTVKANRQASGLNRGHPFKLNRPEVGLNNVVMRVVDIDFGDGRNNQITINCVEDVFSMPALPVVSVGGSEGKSPVQAPAPSPARLVTEAPYLELVKRVGQTQADSELASFPEAGYLMVAAQRPSGDALNAGLAVDAGAGYQETATIDFAPVATLASDIGRLDESLMIAAGVDLDEVAVGSLAQLGSELVRVDALDAVAGTVSIGRACLDTVPEQHVAGEQIWFLDFAADGDEVQHAAGDMLDVKVLPGTGQGRLDLASAPADTMTMAGRAIRPYPPGNLKFAGSLAPAAGDYFPVAVFGALTLTWAHRDRLLQTSGSLADFLDGDIGPEPGATYTVEIREAGSLVESASGISDTNWTSSLTGTRDLEVTLYSMRDGIAGWQAHVHSLILHNDNFRLTEDGALRLSESGQLRELQ